MINLVKIQIGYEQLARMKIVDNYSWHKKAWSMFEHHPELENRNLKSEKDRGTSPFLSRFTQKSDHVELLILSKFPPLRPDWCENKQWQSIGIDDKYLSQDSYLFDLYANPTRSVKKPDGNGGYTKNGKRLTIMDNREQQEWIKRKGNDHGFQLFDEFPLRIEKPVNHPFKRKEKRGLHIGVRFQGMLKVIQQDKFKKAVYEGIGSAKGFGFGMLIVKPAQL